MKDIHNWTDQELKRLEKKIKNEYTTAYKSCKDEMIKIKAKIDAMTDDEQKKKLLWRQYDRLNNLCEQMADVLQDTTKTAKSFVEKSMQNIFRENYNADAERLGFSLIDNTAVKNILTGEVNPFTKLSWAGEADKKVIMRKLESSLTTSILRGDSIPNMAKELKNVAEGYLGDAIRIARTETTRVENSAHQSVGEHGKKMGYDMWKRWVSAGNDGRTRDAHLQANGQEVPIDEPFKVDGEYLMYPGDISLGASAGNVINCRCVSVNFIKI